MEECTEKRNYELRNLYEDLFDIFLFSNFKKKDELIKMCNCVLKIAKYKLQFDNVSLVFSNNLQQSSGCTNYSEIEINEKLLNKNNIFEAFNTVFHEAQHIYQHTHKLKYKTPNSGFAFSLPLQTSSYGMCFLSEQKLGINPFYLYKSSLNEKEARIYANKECQLLAKAMYRETILKMPNNKKLIKLLQTNIGSIEQSIINEDVENARLSAYINTNKQTLPFNIQSYILDEYHKLLITQQLINERKDDKSLKDLNNRKSNIKLTITTLMQIYCDGELTKKLINYCNNYNDYDFFTTIVNSNMCLITINDLRDYFKMSDNLKIPFTEMSKKLSNWFSIDLSLYYKEYQDIEAMKKAREYMREQQYFDENGFVKQNRIKDYNKTITDFKQKEKDYNN